MSNMKLIMESWRGYINESISLDISSISDKALCKARSPDGKEKIYILYDPSVALEKLKEYTGFNKGYKDLSDDAKHFNPFRYAAEDSILSLISLKDSKGGTKGIGPYDAKEVVGVASNKKGFGRIIYLIAMADSAMVSDRNSLVSKFAQDVWKDFYDNSKKIEKEPETGDIIRNSVPNNGIARIKIDNIDKPETKTKEDDGVVYSERGENDPLNFVYYNFSGNKNLISSLVQNHENFIDQADKIVQKYNQVGVQLPWQQRRDEVPRPKKYGDAENKLFIQAGKSAFGKIYAQVPADIKSIKSS